METRKSDIDEIRRSLTELGDGVEGTSERAANKLNRPRTGEFTPGTRKPGR